MNSTEQTMVELLKELNEAQKRTIKFFEELVKDTPNDADLGAAMREIFTDKN